MPDPGFILDPSTLAAPLDIAALYGERRPLEVDVGCGKGRFLVARARQFPRTCFLGIDRRQKRIEKVSRKIRQEQLTNVRLLKLEAAVVVEELLPPLSASAIYLFFPDPWPKRRHHRRRLFSPPFMDALHRALIPGGGFHAATDYAEYFAQIHSLLRKDSRFRELAPFEPSEEERSEFELTFRSLGQPIYRCSFVKPDA